MFVTFPARKKELETLEAVIADGVTPATFRPRDTFDTRTYHITEVNDTIRTAFMVGEAKHALETFCTTYADVIGADMKTLYRHYEIPKKGSMKTRPIDDPCPRLREAHLALREILCNYFYADNAYHTCAFAYINHRGTLPAVKRHQANKSRWILKTDIHGFFPNTTPEFLFRMLYCQFPYCEFIRYKGCQELFERAMSVCFLNNGLPQGSVMSPMLTNIMMIPMDYYINRYCHKHTPYLVYTRYADDMIFSSQYSFTWSEVVEYLTKLLTTNGAGFTLNREKLHYGSSSGRDWILGVMYNKDYQITVGYKNKEQMRAVLNNFIIAYQKDEKWSLQDTQALLGKLNYFNQVEPGFMEKIMTKYNTKYGINTMEMIKSILKTV